MGQKTAFITGANGQDASYLIELLLSKGYKIVGLIRRSSTSSLKNIEHLLDKITLVYGDITDQSNLNEIMLDYRPDEVYGLAAMSFVPVSWQSPAYTLNVNILGTLRLLEAIRLNKPDARFYFAGSSEQFGKVREMPQNEATPFYPRSPYAVSKVAGYELVRNYRESYSMFCCSGIAFNHESPRRGLEFVTRKITHAVARISLGLQDTLKLGNLDACRDWSFSGDIVQAMWMMLQNDRPVDYVIGSGEMYSVKQFCSRAFMCRGLYWEDYVKIDSLLYRPAEVDRLLSDASKIRDDLGWQPLVSFDELVGMMVTNDLEMVRHEKN